MPSLETPPNSAPPKQPIKVRTGRFGELEEHELIHLLDTLDDERSKARFRESIYISVLIYLAIIWFLFYGPRVLFHQPRLISPVEVLKDRDKQLTFLDTPKNLPRTTPRTNKAIPERNHAQPLDQKTLQQLQADAQGRKPRHPQPSLRRQHHRRQRHPHPTRRPAGASATPASPDRSAQASADPAKLRQPQPESG